MDYNMDKANVELTDIATGTHQGVVVDVNDKQLVRIETDVETGKTFVYVWNGVDEDYTTKVEVKI